MTAVLVGLLYLATLAVVLAYAAAGIWAVGLAVLGVLLYVLIREWPTDSRGQRWMA